MNLKRWCAHAPLSLVTQYVKFPYPLWVFTFCVILCGHFFVYISMWMWFYFWVFGCFLFCSLDGGLVPSVRSSTAGRNEEFCCCPLTQFVFQLRLTVDSTTISYLKLAKSITLPWIWLQRKNINVISNHVNEKQKKKLKLDRKIKFEKTSKM